MRGKFFLTASLFLAAVGLLAGTDLRLVEAAHDGDRAAIHSLLAQKVEVSAASADGTTALHWLVRADDLETAELLIHAGADVNARNRRGVAPLDLACLNGSAAMVEKLLAAGADPNLAGPDGQTSLMTAARTGNPETLALLLAHGAAVNAKEAVAQQTALMAAVTENHPDAVRLLIAHGADVNARTTTIETPPATVGNLQGIGRAQNREKAVPEGGMTALLYASRDGDLPITRMLVAAGAGVNQADANGTSALLVATVNGNVEVAKFLLDNGANPNAADSFGRAPLWSAVDLRNLDLGDGSGVNGIRREPVLELIRGLLDRGAGPNRQTRVEPPSRRWMMPFGARQWVSPAGQTPFVRAALANDVAVMRLLLEHGADPAITTLGGTTALMAAAGVGWVPRQTYTESRDSMLEAVKLCVEHGADVNAADVKGLTALHGAAYRGADEVVQFLAQKGARLDRKDNEGRTPLALAGGAYLAGNPPEKRVSTIALIEELESGVSAPR
ncbi:MAG TPA: ankyrin repeat domain-containing protein [Bryobacteraceae bacterium]|jgi:ankyrin repeat protein|nr:ankyrin repeat domain-containing protein [Bryobacteraceae bacterium]